MLYSSLIVGMLALASCGANVDLPGAAPDEDPKKPEPTETVLKDAPFKVGGAVTVPLLKNNSQYGDVIKAELNSLTSENDMKMNALSTAEGAYDWTNADYTVNFAVENDIRMHGHTLIWYREDALPQWIKEYASDDKDEWIEIMETYIDDVVTYFKGRVDSWDVVNEAFEDDGEWRTENIWYQKIGEDYMDYAFKAARKADPDAKLFYNDYGMEYSAAKRTAICDEVMAMKSRGVPVDGIGIQMHINITSDKSSIQTAINEAALCGGLVHVSELDVAVNPYHVAPDPSLVWTEELAQKQKEMYKHVFESYMTIPAAQQFGITFWGVYDDHSWLKENPDWPLPFDREFEKKPAYDGIIEAITE